MSIYRIIRREKCQAVVAGTGDLIDPPAACLAAKLAGVSYYLHLFDDYTYQWIDPIVRKQARSMERWMMPRTKGIIVPNEFMMREVSRRHGRPVFVVRNACARRQDPRIIGGKEKHPNAMMLYTGSVYHVNSNTLRIVMSALDHVRVRNTFLHVYTAQPEEQLRSVGIQGPRVIHHPHVPYAEVERVQREADILLVPFDFESPAAEVIRTAAPGKLGDYLESGTPILAVVPGDSFVAWYLRRHDCGMVVDRADAGAVAGAIQRLLSDAELRARLVANAAARASEDFDPGHAQRTLLRALGVTD
jgi:glycosyltransferase involved in cell wall biosynthesis